MANQITSKKIDSLQALRCLAFLGVFLSHTGADISKYGTGRWGVSVFFVLSGFTMIYSYYGKGKIKSISIKDNIVFAYHKISKLYPLHIITTLAIFIFLFTGNDKTPSIKLSFIQLFLNIFMIQEYFPLYDRSINVVSWFLCTIVLSYFLFPWILRIMENHYNIRKAYTMIAASLLLMLVLGIVATQLPNTPYIANDSSHVLWANNLTSWFLYHFPLMRIWEIIIGYNLGYLYMHTELDFKRNTATFIEAIAIIAVIISMFVYSSYTTSVQGINDMILPLPKLWWTYSLIWIPSTILLVYSFALSKGTISQMLVNKASLYLANISPYGFLIHYVIFNYLTRIWWHIPSINDPKAFSASYGAIICMTLGFVLTIISCEIWIRLESAIKSRISNH